MHTKGEAARKLKDRLKLDSCIYLGNDLNDLSMFSEAINDDDFIVIANHEDKKITNMLIRYLQEECKTKRIKWEDTKLLVLDEDNVNSFLSRTSKLFGILNSRRKSKISEVKSKKETKRRKVQHQNENLNSNKKNNNLQGR